MCSSLGRERAMSVFTSTFGCVATMTAVRWRGQRIQIQRTKIFRIISCHIIIYRHRQKVIAVESQSRVQSDTRVLIRKKSTKNERAWNKNVDKLKIKQNLDRTHEQKTTTFSLSNTSNNRSNHIIIMNDRPRHVLGDMRDAIKNLTNEFQEAVTAAEGGGFYNFFQRLGDEVLPHMKTQWNLLLVQFQGAPFLYYQLLRFECDRHRHIMYASCNFFALSGQMSIMMVVDPHNNNDREAIKTILDENQFHLTEMPCLMFRRFLHLVVVCGDHGHPLSTNFGVEAMESLRRTTFFLLKEIEKLAWTLSNHRCMEVNAMQDLFRIADRWSRKIVDLGVKKFHCSDVRNPPAVIVFPALLDSYERKAQDEASFVLQIYHAFHPDRRNRQRV